MLEDVQVELRARKKVENKAFFGVNFSCQVIVFCRTAAAAAGVKLIGDITTTHECAPLRTMPQGPT